MVRASHRMSHFTLLLGVWLLMSSGAWGDGLFQPLEEAEKAAAKQELQTVWSGYQSEIATAEIDYLALIFTLKSRQLTCDEFCRELSEISLVANESLTRQLVERFCPEKLAGTDEEDVRVLQAVGDWRTFRQQGNDRRCLSRVFEHVLSDDLHLLADHPNHGVRAYRRGDCRYWFETMDWFRTIPNEPLFASSRVSSSDNGQYRLEYDGPVPVDAAGQYASWVTLDQEDGLPRQWEMIAPLTGKLLRRELFQDLTLYPGDVLCPAVRMKINVEDGKVTLVRMSVIQRARFNMSFDEEAFVLSVPTLWSWYDWRQEKHTGGRWTQPVSDVGKFFKERASPSVPPQAVSVTVASSASWRSLLLIVNGAVLIIIGVTLWRRSS